MADWRSDIVPAHRADAETIWNYHRLNHHLHPCSVGIGLGSHDVGVATYAAELYRAGLFQVLLFTGGNSPTTEAVLPRGEAVHYRERALASGVPDSAILVEPRASNTGENIAFSRQVLRERGMDVKSVLLVCKPYMQRRAYATCRKLWPEVEVLCASEPMSLADYVTSIGDERLVIDMIVGDFQRIMEYPRRGFSIPQEVPEEVREAYERLVRSGFDSRVLVN